jgi:hypothetical protein
MTLMTQAAYARWRGVSRQAVSRFIRAWAIATHGPRGLVDADELDGVYYPRVDAGHPQAREHGRRAMTRPRTLLAVALGA